MSILLARRRGVWQGESRIAHQPFRVRGWGSVLGRMVNGVGRCPVYIVISPRLKEGLADLHPNHHTADREINLCQQRHGDRSSHREPHRPARLTRTPGGPRPRTRHIVRPIPAGLAPQLVNSPAGMPERVG